MKLSRRQWRTFRRIQRKYNVSLVFLKYNIAQIRKFIWYAIYPRVIIKRAAIRSRANRVIIQPRLRRVLFDQAFRKIIKKRKANMKRWSKSMVKYLKNRHGAVEYTESITENQETFPHCDEEVRRRMKEQLEILNIQRSVPAKDNTQNAVNESDDIGTTFNYMDTSDEEVAEVETSSKTGTVLPSASLQLSASCVDLTLESNESMEEDSQFLPEKTDAPQSTVEQQIPLEETEESSFLGPIVSEINKKTNYEISNVPYGRAVEATTDAYNRPKTNTKFLDMLIHKVKEKGDVHSRDVLAMQQQQQAQLENEIAVVSPLKRDLSEIDHCTSDSCEEFLGFEENERLPGMLLTPVVPEHIKSREENTAFVSESLDEYMRDNLLDKKIDSEYKPEKCFRKHRQAKLGGLVTPWSPAPHLDMPLVPETLQKLRTVAERRHYLQKFSKNHKMTIINNEATVYRELQRKVRQNKSKSTALLMLQAPNAQMAFTRNGWKAASFVNTEFNKYYYQMLDVDNGREHVRLSGVRGNNDEHDKPSYLSRVSAKKCKRHCGNNCQDAMTWRDLIPIKTDFGKKKLNKAPLSSVFKPCPLSRKPYHKPLDDDTAALLMAGGSMAVVSMPTVELEVFPELEKPLHEVAKRYLLYILPHKEITREWAEFSVSTLQHPHSKAAVFKEPKREGRKSFSFPIPYLNDRNHVLVRRIIDRSEKLDKSFEQAKELESETAAMADLSFRAHLDESNELQMVCANTLSDMINCVAISCSENSFLREDPDGKDAENSVTNTKSLEAASKAHAKELSAKTAVKATISAQSKRQQRLLMELKRLNATVIDAGAMNEKESKSCGKEYCALGCVCASVAEDQQPRQHCGKWKCMLECSCKVTNPSRILRLDTDGRSITTEDAFMLRRKATARLARMEKEFTSTIVLTENETLLINESQLDKKRRCTKTPKRYDDYGDNDDDSVHTSPKKSVGGGDNVSVTGNVGGNAVITMDGTDMVSPSRSVSQLSNNYREAIYVEDRVLDKLKHCTVSLTPLTDIKNVAVWCMVHELYKCFCGGRAIDGKPVIIEKEETDAKANASKEAAESYKVSSARGRYSFERVEDEKPSREFIETVPTEELDYIQPAKDPALEKVCDYERRSKAAKSYTVDNEGDDDDTEGGSDLLPTRHTGGPLVPAEIKENLVLKNKRKYRSSFERDQNTINAYCNAVPNTCRRVVPVPFKVYTRKNRRSVVQIQNYIKENELPASKRLLNEHILRSVYYHKHELEKQRKSEYKELKELQRMRKHYRLQMGTMKSNSNTLEPVKLETSDNTKYLEKSKGEESRSSSIAPRPIPKQTKIILKGQGQQASPLSELPAVDNLARLAPARHRETARDSGGDKNQLKDKDKDINKDKHKDINKDKDINISRDKDKNISRDKEMEKNKEKDMEKNKEKDMEKNKEKDMEKNKEKDMEKNNSKDMGKIKDKVKDKNKDKDNRNTIRIMDNIDLTDMPDEAIMNINIANELKKEASASAAATTSAFASSPCYPLESGASAFEICLSFDGNSSVKKARTQTHSPPPLAVLSQSVPEASASTSTSRAEVRASAPVPAVAVTGPPMTGDQVAHNNEMLPLASAIAAVETDTALGEPVAGNTAFRDFYNVVIKNLNSLVSKKMHDIDTAIKRDNMVVPAPSEDVLCVIKWPQFLNAYIENYVFVWQVKTEQKCFLAATVCNIMPLVMGAIGVVNISVLKPDDLPLVGRMLLSHNRKPLARRLALVMQGSAKYWVLKGLLKNDSDSACAKPTPLTHPSLTRKINVLCSLLIKNPKSSNQIMQRQRQLQKQNMLQSQMQHNLNLLSAVPEGPTKMPVSKKEIPPNQLKQMKAREALKYPQSPYDTPAIRRQGVIRPLVPPTFPSKALNTAELQNCVQLKHMPTAPAPVPMIPNDSSAVQLMANAATPVQIKPVAPAPLQLKPNTLSSTQLMRTIITHPPAKNPRIAQTVASSAMRDIRAVQSEFAHMKSNIEFRKVTSRDVQDIYKPQFLEEDHRWLVLDLYNDFSHIFVPDFRDLVSLDRIHKVMSFASQKKKIVKLQFFQNAPFDAFVTPFSSRKLYFGPLKLNMRPPLLILLQSVDGQMMVREIYQQQHNIRCLPEERTTAFWILQINGQIHFEMETTEGNPDMIVPVLINPGNELSSRRAQPTGLVPTSANWPLYPAIPGEESLSDESDDDCVIVEDKTSQKPTSKGEEGNVAKQKKSVSTSMLALPNNLSMQGLTTHFESDVIDNLMPSERNPPPISQLQRLNFTIQALENSNQLQITQIPDDGTQGETITNNDGYLPLDMCSSTSIIKFPQPTPQPINVPPQASCINLAANAIITNVAPAPVEAPYGSTIFISNFGAQAYKAPDDVNLALGSNSTTNVTPAMQTPYMSIAQAETHLPRSTNTGVDVSDVSEARGSAPAHKRRRISIRTDIMSNPQSQYFEIDEGFISENTSETPSGTLHSPETSTSEEEPCLTISSGSTVMSSTAASPTTATSPNKRRSVDVRDLNIAGLKSTQITKDSMSKGQPATEIPAVSMCQVSAQPPSSPGIAEFAEVPTTTTTTSGDSAIFKIPTVGKSPRFSLRCSNVADLKATTIALDAMRKILPQSDRINEPDPAIGDASKDLTIVQTAGPEPDVAAPVRTIGCTTITKLIETLDSSGDNNGMKSASKLPVGVATVPVALVSQLTALKISNKNTDAGPTVFDVYIDSQDEPAPSIVIKPSASAPTPTATPTIKKCSCTTSSMPSLPSQEFVSNLNRTNGASTRKLPTLRNSAPGIPSATGNVLPTLSSVPTKRPSTGVVISTIPAALASTVGNAITRTLSATINTLTPPTVSTSTSSGFNMPRKILPSPVGNTLASPILTSALATTTNPSSSAIKRTLPVATHTVCTTTGSPSKDATSNTLNTIRRTLPTAANMLNTASSTANSLSKTIRRVMPVPNNSAATPTSAGFVFKAIKRMVPSGIKPLKHNTMGAVAPLATFPTMKRTASGVLKPAEIINAPSITHSSTATGAEASSLTAAAPKLPTTGQGGGGATPAAPKPTMKRTASGVLKPAAIINSPSITHPSTATAATGSSSTAAGYRQLKLPTTLQGGTKYIRCTTTALNSTKSADSSPQSRQIMKNSTPATNVSVSSTSVNTTLNKSNLILHSPASTIHYKLTKSTKDPLHITPDRRPSVPPKFAADTFGGGGHKLLNLLQHGTTTPNTQVPAVKPIFHLRQGELSATQRPSLPDKPSGSSGSHLAEHAQSESKGYGHFCSKVLGLPKYAAKYTNKEYIVKVPSIGVLRFSCLQNVNVYLNGHLARKETHLAKFLPTFWAFIPKVMNTAQQAKIAAKHAQKSRSLAAGNNSPQLVRPSSFLSNEFEQHVRKQGSNVHKNQKTPIVMRKSSNGSNSTSLAPRSFPPNTAQKAKSSNINNIQISVSAVAATPSTDKSKSKSNIANTMCTNTILIDD